MTRVLLLASWPSGERGAMVEPYSPSHIDLASSTVIEAVLRKGWKLRFGGHPAITPLVLSVAHALRAGANVELFQSDFFSAEFTPEMRRLVDVEGAALTPTPVVGGSKTQSLELMRDKMLSDPVDAAFFIGGMDDLKDEFDTLRTRQPTAHVFLVTEPGGQARLLAHEMGASTSQRIHTLDGPAYAALVPRALEAWTRLRTEESTARIDVTQEDLDGLSEKLAALELNKTQRALLDALLDLASKLSSTTGVHGTDVVVGSALHEGPTNLTTKLTDLMNTIPGAAGRKPKGWSIGGGP